MKSKMIMTVVVAINRTEQIDGGNGSNNDFNVFAHNVLFELICV